MKWLITALALVSIVAVLWWNLPLNSPARLERAAACLADSTATPEQHDQASEQLQADAAGAIPLLTPLLASEELAVRTRAVEVLRLCQPLPPATLAALVQTADRAAERSMRYDEGSASYRAIVHIGRPAVPYLVESLNSTEEDVRRQATEALAQIGPDAAAAIPALIENLKHRPLSAEELQLDAADWMISSDASSALAGIGKAAVPALIALLDESKQRVRFDAGSALARIGAPAVPALEQALQSENPRVRAAAVQTLEHMGAPARSVADELVRLLNDADPTHEVPRLAARALGSLELHAAVPALLKLLHHRELHVATHAADALRALGSQQDTQLVEVLSAALWDESAQACAAEAIAAMGPRAVETAGTLNQLLANPDLDPRTAQKVQRALSEVRGPGSSDR